MVMYGHNVTSGAMFHDVYREFFKKEEAFLEKEIYIYTMDGIFVFKPFSIYETKSTDFYFRTSFPSEASFLAFADEMKAKSKYSSDVEVKSGDMIITLSTCTNGAQDGRYALHAVLCEVIN